MRRIALGAGLAAAGLLGAATLLLVGGTAAGGDVLPGETQRAAHPAVTITSTGPAAPVLSGERTALDVTVVDTGDTVLTGLRTSDPQASDCARRMGHLRPRQTARFRCWLTAPARTSTRPLSVTGRAPDGRRVTATTTAALPVAHPSVDVTISAPTRPVAAGSPVTYTVTVINTGDIWLVHLATHDRARPACGRPVGLLALGSAFTYRCTVRASAGGIRVGVVGEDIARHRVTASAGATVRVAVLTGVTPPSGGVGAIGAGGVELPATGPDVLFPSVLAAALMAFGGVLTAASRRPTRT